MLHNEKFTSMSALEAFCAGGIRLGVSINDRLNLAGLTLTMVAPAGSVTFSRDNCGMPEMNADIDAAGAPMDTLRVVCIDRQLWLVPRDYSSAVGLQIDYTGNEQVLTELGLSNSQNIVTVALDDESGVAPKRVKVEETSRGFVNLQWESA